MDKMVWSFHSYCFHWWFWINVVSHRLLFASIWLARLVVWYFINVLFKKECSQCHSVSLLLRDDTQNYFSWVMTTDSNPVYLDPLKWVYGKLLGNRLFYKKVNLLCIFTYFHFLSELKHIIFFPLHFYFQYISRHGTKTYLLHQITILTALLAYQIIVCSFILVFIKNLILDKKCSVFCFGCNAGFKQILISWFSIHSNLTKNKNIPIA